MTSGSPSDFQLSELLQPSLVGLVDWVGIGLGMGWEWVGNGLGMGWEWVGNGLGMASVQTYVSEGINGLNRLLGTIAGLLIAVLVLPLFVQIWGLTGAAWT